MTALAITDHHNMDGFEAFREAARAFPAVKWVSGMEVSVSTQWGEFDIVALGVRDDAPARLADVVDRYRDWMREFNRVLLDGFKALNVPFGQEEKDCMLANWRPGPAVSEQGEVRLANNGLKPWLIERGVIANEAEFGQLMWEACERAGGKPPLPPAEAVLPRFRELGAVFILAHPKFFLEREGEAAFEALVEGTDVDGIEAGHAKHTDEQAASYMEFAGRRGLLISGGTDTHFPRELNEGDLIGRHKCSDELAAPLLERLRVRSGHV